MKTIYHIIEDNARKNPDFIAIVSGNKVNSLTYQDLWQFTRNIHRQLNSLGIPKNSKIALLAPANSPETATAILALSSYATCVVVNPKLTERELIEYLSQLSIEVIVFFPEYSYLTNPIAVQLNLNQIKLIREANYVGKFTLEMQEEKRLLQDDNSIKDNDLALIFATSGTTGKSKLVPLTHQSLYYCCEKTAKILQLSEKDICLNLVPLYHVHGIISNFFLPLFTGGKVCLNGDFNPSLFLDWLTESEATWYSVAPPIHQIILNIIEEKGLENREINLRFIRSGAASLSNKIITDLEQLLKIPLIEAYGMTEIPNLTSNRLDLRKLNSVGKTIGSEIAIIDQCGNFLPQGEIGEIIVKGENVISSYLNNDEVNQNSFINGWFKTGDLGYLDKDNYLFLQGRLKEIINRGGNNIAPQEIDNIVMELKQIFQSVTFPVLHPTLGEDVVTAVVLRQNETITPQDIREYLFQKLADYKVPTEVIIVDKIPTEATGKIKRINLAAKLSEALNTDKILPRNNIEIKLVEIWQEVLNREEIGINDNFFRLGGDSLLATKIVSRIRTNFMLELPLRNLFEYPTIAQLCDRISQMKIMETGEI